MDVLKEGVYRCNNGNLSFGGHNSPDFLRAESAWLGPMAEGSEITVTDTGKRQNEDKIYKLVMNGEEIYSQCYELLALFKFVRELDKPNKLEGLLVGAHIIPVKYVTFVSSTKEVHFFPTEAWNVVSVKKVEVGLLKRGMKKVIVIPYTWFVENADSFTITPPEDKAKDFVPKTGDCYENTTAYKYHPIGSKCYVEGIINQGKEVSFYYTSDDSRGYQLTTDFLRNFKRVVAEPEEKKELEKMYKAADGFRWTGEFISGAPDSGTLGEIVIPPNEPFSFVFSHKKDETTSSKYYYKVAYGGRSLVGFTRGYYDIKSKDGISICKDKLDVKKDPLVHLPQVGDVYRVIDPYFTGAGIGELCEVTSVLGSGKVAYRCNTGICFGQQGTLGRKHFYETFEFVKNESSDSENETTATRVALTQEDTMKNVKDAFVQTNNKALKAVQAGAAQAGAHVAHELLLAQIKKMCGKHFPEEFFATPVGAAVLGMGSAYALLLASGMVDHPLAERANQVAELALTAATYESATPLLNSAKELVEGVVTAALGAGLVK
jgi:hypothetical protein